MLRGALARLYLDRHGSADEGFRELFLEDSGSRFGPLDPAPRTLPLTAAACKRTPGFSKAGQHGMADQLWLRIGLALAEQDGRTVPIDELEQPFLDCGVCGAAMRDERGFYEWHDQTYHASRTDRRRVETHVGIDRHTMTAARSILYSNEILEPNTPVLINWIVARTENAERLRQFLKGEDLFDWLANDKFNAARLQQFLNGEDLIDWLRSKETNPRQLKGFLKGEDLVVWLRTPPQKIRALIELMDVEDLTGWIETTDDNARRFQELLEEEENCIDVGHARTRGYGRVRLEWGEPFAAAGESPTRWNQWSEDLKVFLKSEPFRLEGPQVEGFYFSLGLPSGAIVVDELLRYSLDPRQALSGNRPEIECLLTVARHERVRGWNAAHGLPRQDEWAIARGSVFVYRFTGEDKTGLFDWLNTLEREGLGLRQGEGFGQVEVSAQFHRDLSRQEGTSA